MYSGHCLLIERGVAILQLLGVTAVVVVAAEQWPKRINRVLIHFDGKFLILS